jgi:hypothetical protein
MNRWFLWCSDHLAWLKNENPQKRDKWIQREHHKTFAEWLKDKVSVFHLYI